MRAATDDLNAAQVKCLAEGLEISVSRMRQLDFPSAAYAVDGVDYWNLAAVKTWTVNFLRQRLAARRHMLPKPMQPLDYLDEAYLQLDASAADIERSAEITLRCARSLGT